MTAGGVVDGDVSDFFFTTHPSMANSALFRVNGLLNIGPTKFLVGAEVKISAYACGNRADIKV